MSATVSFDQPRTIRIEGLDVLRTGRSDSGKGWTLYRVWATENGVPIPEELRTFSKLTGEVEVTAEAFIKDGAISHYTLRPTDRAREKFAAERAAETHERRRTAREAIVGPSSRAADEASSPASAETNGRLNQLEVANRALEERVGVLEQQLEVLSNVVLARASTD